MEASADRTSVPVSYTHLDVYKRQDGNRYIDYIDSWGPMILGHNFPEIREAVLKACEKGLSFGLSLIHI